MAANPRHVAAMTCPQANPVIFPIGDEVIATWLCPGSSDCETCGAVWDALTIPERAALMDEIRRQVHQMKGTP